MSGFVGFEARVFTQKKTGSQTDPKKATILEWVPDCASAQGKSVFVSSRRSTFGVNFGSRQIVEPCGGAHSAQPHPPEGPEPPPNHQPEINSKFPGSFGVHKILQHSAKPQVADLALKKFNCFWHLPTCRNFDFEGL